MNFAHNRDGKGKKVATFDGDSVTAEELATRFSQMAPSTRAHYQTLEQRKEYVKGLARFQVLADEAVRRGLHDDPDVLETAKKVMVSRLVEKELTARAKKPTDAELREYYHAHQADYVRPEKVRLAHVFIAAPKDSLTRGEKQKQAEAVLAKAKAEPDFTEFAELVRENSDDVQSKAIDGDLRYLSLDELTQRFGPEVATAAGKLEQTGQLAPEVVATAKGFHVIKFQARQPALDITFDQVKEQLEGRLMNEQRMRDYDAFVAELLAKSKFQVDDAALKDVPLDLGAPAVQPASTNPGYAVHPAESSGG